ncbi:MAG: hypothetical protein EBV01_07135 [Betaproteobacteria bacterium]|nr:hypothetical protein [Betaproteobacteria bacterium]NBP35167.1 hypothetical protein [Betaproteobacteria bacterium]NCY06785.1 hypothetical protein [Betaproteobacteria bacterium]
MRYPVMPPPAPLMTSQVMMSPLMTSQVMLSPLMTSQVMMCLRSAWLNSLHLPGMRLLQTAGQALQG